jgi:hypothetical protein
VNAPEIPSDRPQINYSTDRRLIDADRRCNPLLSAVRTDIPPRFEMKKERGRGVGSFPNRKYTVTDSFLNLYKLLVTKG